MKKKGIDIKFTEQKADTGNDENAIDFRWSNVQGEDEEVIAKAKWLKAYKSNLMKKFFIKGN